MFKPSIADKIAAAKSETTGITGLQQVPMSLENTPGDTGIAQPKLTNVNQASSQAASGIITSQDNLAPNRLPDIHTRATYNTPETAEFTGDAPNTRIKSTGFRASLQDAIDKKTASLQPSRDITVNSRPITDPEIQSAPNSRPSSRPEIPMYNPSNMPSLTDPTLGYAGQQPTYRQPVPSSGPNWRSAQPPALKAPPKPR